jgi:hypothetical protein
VSENEGRPPEETRGGDQPPEGEPPEGEPHEGEPPTAPEPQAAAEPPRDEEPAAQEQPATPAETPAPVAAAAAATPAAAQPQWDATAAAPVSGYPLTVDVPKDPGQNRLWGIPFVGLVIRSILVIPQWIVLVVLGFLTGLLVLVSWIPVLINGRQASFIYTVTGGYLRLSTRVALYVFLLTGKYPPFGPGGEYPINVTFDETERQNRLWGIPFVGIWVRLIVRIPHYIVLALIGIVVAFLLLVSWAPVLFTGRQADVITQWVGGFYRWAIRVSAYSLLLTGKYPPFRLED